MTDYDNIAEQYKRSKEQPWRTHIEVYSFMKCIGDVTGKHVMDLACGDGFYTRMLRQKGAASVVGIDISKEMIALARQHPFQDSIDYLVGDARHLTVIAKYDLVVAAYLLNYARNEADLAAMYQAIASYLKPGGRFVTIACEPLWNPRSKISYRKYGFEKTIEDAENEWAAIKWTLYEGESSFEIENYRIHLTTHMDILRAAGLRDVFWGNPEVDPAHAGEYWDDFLVNSPIVLLECEKS